MYNFIWIDRHDPLYQIYGASQSFLFAQFLYIQSTAGYGFGGGADFGTAYKGNVEEIFIRTFRYMEIYRCKKTPGMKGKARPSFHKEGEERIYEK